MEVFVVCKLGLAVLILAFTQLQLSALDRGFARDKFLLKILGLLCRKLEERH